ncbi:hypothetical protein C497_17597 [Halalkalicoccus jeotgali B3]|uniref:NodB homology domain-containing protein n=2 Tax=Halalkalicoccus jeotgali TaxID=413810 RepID=D8J5T1_HALJB|nr:hypothetical protein HacjB3_01720 [Halalkalicoccus jeotgali B3]ELY34217.1 hypothetical protein C497_17597 [Halalkalicoccus jeotgali B3]
MLGSGETDNNGNGNGGGGNGSGGGSGGTNGEETQATPPITDAGELIDDFEDAESWTPMDESNVAGDGEAALTGSQALRIENQGTTAGVFQAFPDGLDVSGNHLSLAIRVESPRPTRVRLEIDAPARADQLWTSRTVLSSHEGWFRMDAGWTGQRGEPNLGNIQEMRIYVQGQEEQEIRFWIDDLRMTPAGDQGYVILSFDDGAASQYERAFPILEEYGYQGAAAVIPDSLNRPQRLSIDQLREMRDAGWDISSHPDPGSGLTEVDLEEARNTIESSFEYLTNRGFPDGARHMFVPYHDINQEVMEIVSEYHESCFYFAGNNSNAPPTDPLYLSRVDMHDVEGFTSLIDMAAQHNQLAVGLAHGVQPEDAEEDDPLADITTEQLREVLDYIEQSDVEVITPSQLIDNV